jgi:hypothetical protein
MPASAEKYEISVSVLTGRATRREAAAEWKVDRPAVVHVCRVARRGALDALPGSVPGRPGLSPEAAELAAAREETGRLRAAVTGQAVALHLHQGRPGWDWRLARSRPAWTATSRPACWSWPVMPSPGAAGPRGGRVRCPAWTTGGQHAGRTVAPPGSWRTGRRAGTRCTACCGGSARRSLPCPETGAGSAGRTARSPAAAPGSAWSTCPGLRRAACQVRRAWSSRARRRASRSRAARGRWLEWKPDSVCACDFTRWARARRAWIAILDVVSRTWLATLTSAGESSTPVEACFLAALDAEDLPGLADEPATAALRAAIASGERDEACGLAGGGQVPLLLAISGNGPQMRSVTTREFMAGVAIGWQSGRPHTAQDQAWIETLSGHVKGRMAAPGEDPRPRRARRRARPRPGRVQHRPAARIHRLRHTRRRARGPGRGDPPGPP